jgi:hypothetical protein
MHYSSEGLFESRKKIILQSGKLTATRTSPDRIHKTPIRWCIHLAAIEAP